MIVVRLGRDRTLRAGRIDVPASVGFGSLIEGDGARPRSVFISTPTKRGSTVRRLDLTASGPRLVHLFSLPDGLAVTFDRSGHRLLYLVGHNPPDLWSADITNERLLNKRLLLPATMLQAGAW